MLNNPFPSGIAVDFFRQILFINGKRKWNLYAVFPLFILRKNNEILPFSFFLALHSPLCPGSKLQ